MYVLYGVDDWGSQVIHMMLNVIGAKFQYQRIDYDKGEMKSAAFLALNPYGRIPVLKTPEGIVFETAAILLYLADKHEGIAPRASDPDRGQFLTCFALTTTTLHPLAMTLLHPERPGGDAAQADVLRVSHAAMPFVLSLINGQTGAWWLAGHRPSILSCYVAMLLRWIQVFAAEPAFNIALDDYPDLRAMLINLESHPAIAATLKAERLPASALSAPE